MKKLFTVLLFGLLFSCGDKDEPNVPEIKKVTDYDIKIEMKGDIKKVTITDLWTSSPEGEKMYYHKFNLEKGKYVEGDDWDIAFYNRAIIVNGGKTLISGGKYGVEVCEKNPKANAALAIMGSAGEEILYGTDSQKSKEWAKENLLITAKETDGDYLKTKEVPENIEFKQDIDDFAIDDFGAGMFEYNLSLYEHIVMVKKNRFLIIRTHNGHYAKLKLLSYYQGAGATAKKSVETGSMKEGLKYANYFTFTYKYNTKKGDRRLE